MHLSSDAAQFGAFFSMFCDVIKSYDDILAFWYNYHMQLMIFINKTPNFAILQEV